LSFPYDLGFSKFVTFLKLREMLAVYLIFYFFKLKNYLEIETNIPNVPEQPPAKQTVRTTGYEQLLAPTDPNHSQIILRRLTIDRYLAFESSRREAHLSPARVYSFVKVNCSSKFTPTTKLLFF